MLGVNETMLIHSQLDTHLLQAILNSPNTHMNCFFTVQLNFKIYLYMLFLIVFREVWSNYESQPCYVSDLHQNNLIHSLHLQLPACIFLFPFHSPSEICRLSAHKENNICQCGAHRPVSEKISPCTCLSVITQGFILYILYKSK